MIKFTIPGKPRALQRHRIAKNGRMYDPSYKDKKQIIILSLVPILIFLFNKTMISSVKFFKNNFPIKPSKEPVKIIRPCELSSKSSNLQCGSEIVSASKKDFEESLIKFL